MAITYRDEFTGAAGNVVGRTPDTAGTNVWVIGDYNTITTDGAGAAYNPTGNATEAVFTGDVAGDEYHEVTAWGVVIQANGTIGVMARKSGTAGLEGGALYAYSAHVLAAGYVELRRYNGAAAFTSNIGGFPGGGLTQIAGITPGTTVVDFRLVTQNSGADVVLEVWYRLDGGTWTRVNDAAYTDTAPGTTYTDPGYDGFHLTPGSTTPETSISAFDSNTLSAGADTTAPTVDTFSVPSPNVTGTTIINITAFTASDNVGVTHYLVTDSATPPASGDAGWAVSAQTTFDLGSYRSATLYPWAKDAANNVSAVYGSPIAVSASAGNAVPVVTNIVATDATLIDSHVFEITVTATDSDGTVAGYALSTNGTAPGAAQQVGNVFSTFDPGNYGEFSVWAWAYDNLGAVSLIAAPITINSVNSAGSASFAPHPFNGGFLA